jgi:hypothetical protein
VNIPPIIVQGDSVTWRDVPTQDNLGNQISSPNWTLTWYLIGSPHLNVVSTPYNGGWETSLTSVQTAGMTAADATQQPNYYWQAKASYGSQTITIGSGTLLVQQNIATAPGGYDGRTQAERDLAAVQLEIRARIDGGMTVEYSIGTRRLRKEAMSALLELESRLKMIVSKERQAQSIANGLGDPRNTFVRFT